MSAIATVSIAQPEPRPLGIWKSLRHQEPGFYALGMLLLTAMAPTAFAAAVDGRTFLGEDNWIKPLKFEAALAVYVLTLAFFARWLPEGTTEKRWYRIYSFAVVAAIAAEMIWIAGAAALGAASHFNTTPMGATIYAFMGAGAVLLTSAPAVYAWQIARNGTTGLRPAAKESIVIGLALVLPLTLLTAGTMSSMDAHAVGGTAESTTAFPLMGWVRDGGDLRVAHFFATHTMHFIPAFGLMFAGFFGAEARLPVRIFAIVFVAFVGWTFFEALADRPFLPGIG